MNDATVGAQASGRLPAVAVGVAVLLQLVVGFFTVTGIGLVGMPLWAIVVAAALWLGAALLLYLLARRNPLVTPLVPVSNGVLLWALISFGEGSLGWMS